LQAGQPLQGSGTTGPIMLYVTVNRPINKLYLQRQYVAPSYCIGV